MRMGLCWAMLVLVPVLGGCGVPLQKYNAQIARADRLKVHLQKKMDRIDTLEAKEALGRKKTRKSQTGDVKRLTRLATEIARVRTALGHKERALSTCRATRGKSAPTVPITHTIRASKCDHYGVTVAVGEGLMVRVVDPTAQRLHPRARARIRAVLSRALARGLAPIAQCYLKETRRSKRTVRGQLVVTLRVDKRGRVRGVKAAHKGLRARRVIKCALKALGKLRVDGLKGTAFAVVPLRFGRSKAFVISPKGCSGKSQSSPSRAAIDRIIRRHHGEIQYCFISSGLPARKLAWARVKVAFSILATGKVGPVSVVSSTEGHAATCACIQRAVKRWKFPPPKGSTPLMTPQFRWYKPRDKRRRRRRRSRQRRRHRRR